MLGQIKHKKKKYRLKKWVKEIVYGLLAIFILILFGIFTKARNDCKEKDKRGDEARGYTCKYYDVRQYLIKGE